jgi:hypothetical protein
VLLCLVNVDAGDDDDSAASNTVNAGGGSRSNNKKQKKRGSSAKKGSVDVDDRGSNNWILNIFPRRASTQARISVENILLPLPSASSLHHSSDVVFDGDGDNNGDIPHSGQIGVTVYGLTDLSKNELKALKDLRSEHTHSVTLLLPVRGKAKLMTVGMQLSRAQVAGVFYGTNVSEEEGGEGGGRGRGRDYYAEDGVTLDDISEQVMESRQTIVFDDDNDDEEDEDDDEEYEERVDDNKAEDSEYVDGESSAKKENKRAVKNGTALVNRRSGSGSGSSGSGRGSCDKSNSLIKDLPLGMRLLNAYRCGYNDRCLRVWSHEAYQAYEALEAADAANSTPVGYARGKQQQPISATTASTGAGAESGTGPGTGSGVDEKIIVKLQSTLPKWVHICETGGDGGQGTRTKVSTGLMPRHALCAVAVHCGAGAIYAATHRSLFVGGMI